MGYLPLTIEFTRANSSKDKKMKIVLVMNHMSIYLMY